MSLGGWDGCHHLIDLGIVGRILLKRILKKGKYVRDWILSARYKFQLLTCKPSGFLNSRNFLRIWVCKSTVFMWIVIIITRNQINVSVNKLVVVTIENMFLKVTWKTYCCWRSHRDVSLFSTAIEKNSHIIPSKRSHLSVFRKIFFEQLVNFPAGQDIASLIRSILPCWRYLNIGLNWLVVDLRIPSTYFNAGLHFHFLWHSLACRWFWVDEIYCLISVTY